MAWRGRCRHVGEGLRLEWGRTGVSGDQTWFTFGGASSAAGGLITPGIAGLAFASWAACAAWTVEERRPETNGSDSEVKVEPRRVLVGVEGF